MSRSKGIYDDLVLPVGTEGRPYTAINMVMTVDGAITGPRPGYWPLGGEADRVAYRRLRIHFDAIIRGARTLGMNLDRALMEDEFLAARADRGLGSPPLFVTLTNSGALDPADRVFRARRYPFRPLVITHAGAELTPGLGDVAEVVRIGDKDVDLAAAFGYLAGERGVRRLLCEGGPTINYAVIARRLADDFFITVTPKIIGEPRPRTAVEGPSAFSPDDLPDLKLLSNQSAGGEVFLRYRFVGSPFGPG